MSKLRLLALIAVFVLGGCQAAPQPTSSPSGLPAPTPAPPAPTPAPTVTPTATPPPSPTSTPAPGASSWETLAIGPGGATYDGLGPLVLLSNGQVLALWVTNSDKVRASIYDPSSDTWTNSPAPPCSCLLVALPDGTEFAIDDLYVRSDGQPDTASYLRDSPDQDWRRTAQLPDSRDYMLQVGLPDSRVLVLGGLDDSTGARSSATDFYDPSSDTWTAGPSLPFDGADSVGVLADGSVLVLATSGRAARLDPGASEWIAAGKASVGAEPVIAAFGPGAIALAGSAGRVISSPDRHTAIYDEAANAWSAGPQLAKSGGVSPGIGATAVQLADGRLLLVGGTQGGDFSPTRGAATLAPDGSSWTSVASAPVDLADAVGELLPDGSIVVAGEAADFDNDVGPYLGAFRFTP